MNKTEVLHNISRALYKASFQVKKHSPEILIVAGTIGVITSAVLACKATPKADAIIKDTKQHVKDVKNVLETPALQEKYVEKYGEEFTEEDCKKEVAVVYAKTGLDLVKTYAPAAALMGLSLAAILTSHGILHKRNLAISAAYMTIDQGFKEYRGRVIDRFGKELDRELKYNIKAKEIEEKVVGEDGQETTVKRAVNTIDENYKPGGSTYARYFDEYCTGWDRCAEYNLVFLKNAEAFFNQKLREVGYVYLNDIYEYLGIPKTRQGQVVGWVYDEVHPVGDNYIDFGIYDLYNENARDFVNGRESRILLDFNVDGVILDLMQ